MPCALDQESCAQPGHYVPQLGDEVVYCSQGHAQYLQRTAQVNSALAAAAGAASNPDAHMTDAGSVLAAASTLDAPMTEPGSAPSATPCTPSHKAGCLRAGLRPFEPCRVVGLSYALAQDGALVQNTVAR